MIFKFWGSQYSQHNTWWDLSRGWHTYLSRCFYLMRQGKFSASVVFMTAEEIPGDEKTLARHAARAVSNGYDWDLCSSRSVKEMMSFQDGEFRLPSGMGYNLLVLPKMERITTELLYKLKSFLEAGGSVLVESKPSTSYGLSGYPKSESVVKTLVDEIWQDLDGNNVKEITYGKGRLYWGLRTGDILKRMKVEPDLRYSAGHKKWYQYIHRYTDDADIYFISANSDNTPTGLFSFKGSDRVPELWYPDMGKIEKCAVYSYKDGRTQIPLLFDRYGSVFVVLRDKEKEAHASSAKVNNLQILSTDRSVSAPTHEVFSVSGELSLQLTDGSELKESFVSKASQELNTDWTVTFPAESDIEKPVQFKSLSPWNKHKDERIRYFSGTAIYSREFECKPENNEVWLDLGRVEVISDVYINGQQAQILWKAPYRANITHLVRPGTNTVQVHVANLWPNRLIGDERFPKDFESRGGFNHKLPKWLIEDLPRPEKRRKTFSTYQFYKKDDPLLPSGMMGPVRLYYSPKFESPLLQQVSDLVARHGVNNKL